MSRYDADRLADAISGRPSFLAPRFATGEGDQGGIFACIRQLAAAKPSEEMTSWADRKAQLPAEFGMSMMGDTAGPPEKAFAFANGVAIIPIYGMLLNRFPYCWGFVTGYNFIQQQLMAAQADGDVKLIAYDVNSYGGVVSGCAELSKFMFDTRDLKPTVAIVDASCFSAAYFLASAAQRVIVTPSSGVGSIGCLAVRLDVTKMMDTIGVKADIIYAGANKLDGNDMVPMSAGERARIQAHVDFCYASFVSSVARNRGLEEEVIRGTEASFFDPPDALALGLIDDIQPPAAALEAAIDDLCDPETNPENEPMAKTSAEYEADILALQSGNAAAVAAAQAAAATTERTRIQAITTCAEAAGKPKMASHLALNTTMSAEEAKGILAAAATETPAAPAEEVDPLKKAMAETQNPNVTADGPKPGGDGANTPANKAATILASQVKATGIKHATH